ncbi:hypothetical protein MTO96_022122 [Rhipicephalus appendiculatus]
MTKAKRKERVNYRTPAVFDDDGLKRPNDLYERYLFRIRTQRDGENVLHVQEELDASDRSVRRDQWQSKMRSKTTAKGEECELFGWFHPDFFKGFGVFDEL